MQLTFKTWDTKRFLTSLPDFWFLALLLVGWVDVIISVFAGAWYAVNIILGLFLLAVTVIFVKQIFNRKVAISSIMGFIFLLISLYFSLALFSELSEFPSLSEPGAMKMMLGGGIFVGGSLIMSVLMMIRSSFK